MPNDTPSAHDPDEPQLDSSGFVFGCLAQTALFFVGYAAVLVVAPNLVSTGAGLGGLAISATLLLVGWLVPVLFVTRTRRRARASIAHTETNLLFAWIAASALIAALTFILSNLRV